MARTIIEKIASMVENKCYTKATKDGQDIAQFSCMLENLCGITSLELGTDAVRRKRYVV